MRVKARPPTTHSDQPRVKVLINDNYCVTQRGFVERPGRKETFVNNCQTLNATVNHVATKEMHKTHCKTSKLCERCFLCRSVVFCPTYHQCLHCCSKSACGGQTEPVLESLGHPGGQSQGHKNPQGRLHPPLPEPTNFDQVLNNYKCLCRNSWFQNPRSKF